MPLTDQDARALTYLARRLREDTYGANEWDVPGVYAVVSELIGQNLATSVESVTRHAADPEAKTPGAIRRPFTPPPAVGARQPYEHLAPEDRCRICSKSRTDCGRNPHGEHEFEPDIRAARDYDIAPVITELKGHLKPMSPPADPRPVTRTERGDEIRARMTTTPPQPAHTPEDAAT